MRKRVAGLMLSLALLTGCETPGLPPIASASWCWWTRPSRATRACSRSGPTRDLAAKMTQELRRAVEANLTTGMPPGKYQGLKIYFAWNYNKAYADPSHQFFGTQAWTDFLKAYDIDSWPTLLGQESFSS